MRKYPFQPVDDAARAQTRQLLNEATHAALAVVRPDAGTPSVTRIALATDEMGAPLSLVSTLSMHTQALREDPACALLIGEPGAKGDPMTQPRLTLHCEARFVAREDPAHEALRARYLRLRPKAKLYVDFADFGFVRFDVRDGLLNGGFGLAYKLTVADFESP